MNCCGCYSGKSTRRRKLSSNPIAAFGVKAVIATVASMEEGVGGGIDLAASCKWCKHSCSWLGHVEHRESLSTGELQTYPARSPSFVKVLVDSNLAAMATCWMVIPAAFIKLYGNDVGKTAILQGPGGQVWQVGIGRPKWVAFRVGWRTFAADHDLEKGDILVFTLTGKSQFSVKIFDNKTGTEKLSALEARNTGLFDSRTSPVLGEKRKERDDEEMELQLHMKKLCFDIAEGGIMDENPPLQAFESLYSSESKHVQDSSCGKAEALDSPGAHWNLNEPYLHEPSDHLCPANDEYGETITATQEIQLLAHDQLLQVKETDSDDVLQCQTLLGKLPHDAAGEDLNTNKEHLKASNSNANEVKQDYSGVGPATRFASQRRPVVETLRDIMHTDVAYRQSFQARSTSNAQNVQPMINQAGELHREHDKVARPLIPYPGLVMEREKAMELGRFTVLKSDKPCHLVVLRPFHVHGRAFLRFPVTFGKHFMPTKTVPMRLIDASGNQWSMVWLRDNETHMGFTRGWREFSLAEDLSDGDVCVFELLETTDLMFRVHVFRTERKSPSSQKKDSSNQHDHHHRANARAKRLQLQDDNHCNNPYNEVLLYSSGKKRELSGRINMHVGAEQDKETTASQLSHTFSPSLKTLYNAYLRLPPPTDASKKDAMNSREREGNLPEEMTCEKASTTSLVLVMEDKVKTSESLQVHSSSNRERCCKCSKRHKLEPGTECETYMEPGIPQDNTTRNLECDGELLFTACNTGIAKQDDRPGKLEPHQWGATKVDPVFQEEQKLQECHQSITMQRAKPASNGSTAEVKKDSEISAQWWTRTCKPDKQCLRWQSDMSSLRCRKKPGASWRRLTGSNTSLSRNRQASSLLQARVRKQLLFVGSKRLPVTQLQREAARDAACALKTMNPSVVVVMKKSNVYRNFIVKIPPAFRQAHIPCEATDLKLQDAVGQQTHAFLSGEVLTAGWQQFSLHHLLEEGDTCVFELITNKTEDLTFMVHIFRVVEVDHSKVQWQDHYMILSRGKCWNNEMHLITCDKKTKQDSSLAFSEKKNLEDEDATGCLFPGLGSTNALCIAVQKCMVRHNKPQVAKSSVLRERLAYRLWSSSSHPQHTAKTNDASSPAKETTTTTTTICDSRVRGTLEELAKVNQAARSSNHLLTRITIPSYSRRIHEQQKKKKKKIILPEKKKKKKTSNQISKQSRKGNNTNLRAAERMVMPLPADDDDDDDGKGEGIYYRVVRIIKKRFFENEKHYLTELDGPVLQSNEDGVLTEYNGILWWVPERAFSAGFSSCYLD